MGKMRIDFPESYSSKANFDPNESVKHRNIVNLQGQQKYFVITKFPLIGDSYHFAISLIFFISVFVLSVFYYGGSLYS